MKGKRFLPVPDPNGALPPPPRKPPIALATAAPIPPRRNRNQVERIRLPRRRVGRVALIGTALGQVTRSIASAIRRHARV